jgi:hypothetical protein
MLVRKTIRLVIHLDEVIILAFCLGDIRTTIARHGR